MLLGTLIGDAAGAPTEFAEPSRSIWTDTDTVLSAQGRAELAARFRIGPSSRAPDPYGPWTDRLGTLTDDSRFKIIFFDHLEYDGVVSRAGFARAILSFESEPESPYGTLPAEWLEEFALAARWVLGDSVSGLPPERSWGGIATMAGQMPFLPIAGLVPGQPEKAYRLNWDIDFLDNGIGRDINAALVAGLAEALGPDASWEAVERAMRRTDPHRFSEVPWVPRASNRWLDVSREIASDADGRAKRLFELLETRLEARTWWEAWVPTVVVFSCARLADFDPLATMQLILEFGHDTDSYLQVAGAFFGALHGPAVFPPELRSLVRARLSDEYGDSLDRWTTLLRDYRVASD
jgi:ADP-ribosylglycohydrolase